jgi:hypothetical protein
MALQCINGVGSNPVQRPRPLDHIHSLKKSFNNRSVTFSRKANLGIDVRHVYKRVYMVHIYLIL